MSYSLGEVEAQARKAAAGAGYSWGIALEAGNAVRWLHERSGDGCHHLARLILAKDGGGVDHCPLTLGCAIADRGVTVLEAGQTLQDLSAPALLLPFLDWASGGNEWTARVTWSDEDIFIASARTTSLALLDPVEIAALTIQITDSLGKSAAAPANRAFPKPESWDVLTHWAAKTYAPATDASRESGAGAGKTELD